MQQQLQNIAEGHRLLFGFLFRDGRALLSEVSTAWDNPDKVQTSAGEVTRMRFRRRFIDEYNRRYEETKLGMRKLVRTRGNFGPYYLAPLFAVRILTVLAAAFAGVWAAVATSVLQFVVAPYSFFAAVAAWFSIVPYFLAHYAAFALIQGATGLLYARVPAAEHYLRLPITTGFIVVWFVVDQLSCLVLTYWHPGGRPAPVPTKRLLQSIGYGFLNAKTYWLVLLLCLRGFQIDLLALAIFAFMPWRITKLARRLWARVIPSYVAHHTYLAVMFYHYHRMVHLPGPYNEGHRHHHYLLDATPFDAHMHGTGMPEEWLKLMTELGMALSVGLMPWSFTVGAIKLSLFNRLGHTRLENDDSPGENFHVNHHLKHFKNFGFIFFPLDLLFDTAYGNVSGLGHMSKERVRCTKTEDQEHYVLTIEPASLREVPAVNIGPTSEGSPADHV